MFNEMQVSSGGGGSIDTQIKQIDVSSVNVSGTFDSSYSANNAIILNHTKNGWIPTRSATSGWIEIDFGSVKDVDFLFFENSSHPAMILTFRYFFAIGKYC